MSKSSSKWAGLIRASSGDVSRLDHVQRYSSIPVCFKESVSTHSFWVALYAVLIVREFGADQILQGQVALHGLTHDLEECVTGDVVRPFKYSSVEFRQAVDSAEEKMAQTLPDAVQSLLTDTRKDNTSVVKAAVKAADFLSLFQYMRREAVRGNLEIIPFYNRMVSDLSDMAEVSGVSGASDPITAAKFPESFYDALHEEAVSVRSDCFHGLEEDPRWTRPV